MAEPKLKEVKKTLPAVKSSDLKDDGAAIAKFHIILPKTVEIDDILDPSLYVNVAARIPAESEIRVNAEDGSFVAWLYVSHSYKNDMVCHLIKSLKLEDIETQSVNARYVAKLRGRDKWCVVDTHDNSILKSNIATQILCLSEIKDYEQALRG